MKETAIIVALFLIFLWIRRLKNRSVGSLRQAVLGHCPHREQQLLEVVVYSTYGGPMGKKSNRDQHVRLTTVFRSGWNEISDRHVRACLNAARFWLVASQLSFAAAVLSVFIFYGEDIAPFLNQEWGSNSHSQPAHLADADQAAM